MTPSSSAGYREHEGVGEEGSPWPSVSPGVPLSTSGDEATGTKVRKPYTITKQRERWTEEEHQKFLEALKLYGRAWRRIEEHIGTKTAVQIRSHAQKFFSKIERDSTAGAGVETGVAQAIDIPPPRPKRKPTHPYPRKACRGFGKTSEDEFPLTAAGSFSSSSGISTANIAEASVKNDQREHDDHAETCRDVSQSHIDGTKEDDREGFSRQWGYSRTSDPANIIPVAHQFMGASNAGMAIPNPIERLPLPFPAFQTVPWGRLVAGGYTPGLIPPQGMIMPWVGASNAPIQEDGGAATAMAATLAAASAWWAMQGGMPPGLLHPALGALYLGAAPPLAVPAPFLFPQCTPQEVTVAAAPSCVDGKDTLGAHGMDSVQDHPSSSGSLLRSSAMRRAERAQRVKELKARRIGSGNHLMSVSSDICASSSGGNGLNRFGVNGQVTVASLTSESHLSSLSKGVSLPTELNKVKHGLCGLVRKDREPLATRGCVDEGASKKKHLRGGRSVSDSMLDSGHYESIVRQAGSSEAPARSSNHLEKCRSVIGSNCLPVKFTKENGEKLCNERRPASCGSDVSEDVGVPPTDGDASGEGGPSSNSSACGNVPGVNDRSGSSDGFSEGEEEGGDGPSKVDQNLETEKNGSNSSEPEAAEREKDQDTRTTRQFSFSEFLPTCKDGEKHERQGGPSRLQRTVSLDGEQRKEVTERGQLAFQALFMRGTLPRTFSPPPQLTLQTEEPEDRSNSPFDENLLAKQSSSLSLTDRSLSRAVMSNDDLYMRSPDRTCRVQENVSAALQPARGSSSASKVDCCNSRMTTPSSRPTKSTDDLPSPEHRRISNRKERLQALGNNWLQLRTDTSSPDKNERDEDAESGAGEDCETQQEESFVCKLNASERAQDKELIAEVDGLGTTSLDLSSKGKGHPLSVSIGTGSRTAISSVSSTGSVKYSGLGFVPYQRASPSVEPSLKL